MSYDCELLCPVRRVVLELDAPHRMGGPTLRIGGDPTARLGITSNYYELFLKFFGGKDLRVIHGMTGAASIKILRDVAGKLGDDACDNYWTPTEGNAKQAIFGLIALAEMRPDGVWNIE